LGLVTANDIGHREDSRDGASQNPGLVNFAIDPVAKCIQSPIKRPLWGP
jgi:hypothetical protein